MGGEKAGTMGGASQVQGSPPHGRGKDFAGLSCTCREGITPAWAGKRYALFDMTQSTMDHPRVGGEKRLNHSLVSMFIGSPPRGRGKGSRNL